MSRYSTVAMTMAVVATLVAGTTGTAQAQQYDVAFFAKLQPGTPVEGRSGCTWRWSQQSNAAPGWGGWYQECSTPTQNPAPPVETPAPTVTDADCVGVDPYLDGQKALQCALLSIRNRTPYQRPAFQVGDRYVAGYSSIQIVVIGITRDVVGSEVVTYQWVYDTTNAKAGDVGAFVNGSSQSLVWSKVQQ